MKLTFFSSLQPPLLGSKKAFVLYQFDSPSFLLYLIINLSRVEGSFNVHPISLLFTHPFIKGRSEHPLCASLCSEP